MICVEARLFRRNAGRFLTPYQTRSNDETCARARRGGARGRLEHNQHHMPATKVFASLGLLAATANALDNGQGLKPQMGYSSWNDCGSVVTYADTYAPGLCTVRTGYAYLPPA